MIDGHSVAKDSIVRCGLLQVSWEVCLTDGPLRLARSRPTRGRRSRPSRRRLWRPSSSRARSASSASSTTRRHATRARTVGTYTCAPGARGCTTPASAQAARAPRSSRGPCAPPPTLSPAPLLKPTLTQSLELQEVALPAAHVRRLPAQHGRRRWAPLSLPGAPFFS